MLAPAAPTVTAAATLGGGRGRGHGRSQAAHGKAAGAPLLLWYHRGGRCLGSRTPSLVAWAGRGTRWLLTCRTW